MKESSIAVVLPQKPKEQEGTLELITPAEERVKLIKVFELVFSVDDAVSQSLRLI